MRARNISQTCVAIYHQLCMVELRNKNGFYATLETIKWPLTWIRCAKGLLSEISDIPPYKKCEKAKVEPYENAIPRIYREIQDIFFDIEEMYIEVKLSNHAISLQYIDEIYNCLVDMELIYLSALVHR